MLIDDVTNVLYWQRVWGGVTGTKVKVENCHFGPWTDNSYPWTETISPNSSQRSVALRQELSHLPQGSWFVVAGDWLLGSWLWIRIVGLYG